MEAISLSHIDETGCTSIRPSTHPEARNFRLQPVLHIAVPVYDAPLKLIPLVRLIPRYSAQSVWIMRYGGHREGRVMKDMLQLKYWVSTFPRHRRPGRISEFARYNRALEAYSPRGLLGQEKAPL